MAKVAAVVRPWVNKIVRYGEIDPRELVPNPKNWRLHAALQVATFEAAIDEVGWIATVTINEVTGLLVDGHMRAARAIARGESTVPAIWVHLTEAEEATALFTLDPIGAMAGVVEERRAELAALVRTDREELRTLLGEAERSAIKARAELAAALADEEDGEGEVEESAASAAQAKWETAVGDIWEIESASRPGQVHRLAVGDAQNVTLWERLMQGDEAMWMWTDPPYGVNYASKNESLNAADKGNRIQDAIENDEMTAGELAELLRATWANVTAHSAPGSPVYIAHPAGALSVIFGQSVLDAGWHYHEQLIWVKSILVLGRCDYHYRHEPILYGWTKGEKRRWYGGRDKATVVEVPKPRSSGLHPTTKPVDLIAPMLVNSSLAGDIGVDPFCGSGSTLVAAEMTGRLCRGIELTPGYAGVVLERMAGLGLHPRKGSAS